MTVNVPVWPELPQDATTPCAEPRGNPDNIVTDVDLAGLAARWRITALCNARKLTAIGEAMGEP